MKPERQRHNRGPQQNREIDYLPLLADVIAEQRPSTARYYGKARLDVLRFLAKRFDRGAVMAMETGGAVTEEERFELYHHGVIWWEEGGEPAELDIRDSRWPRDQLQKIVAFHKKAAARIWLLAGEATKVDLPRDYLWETRGNCVIGVRTEAQTAFWREVAELRHARAQSAIVHLRSNGWALPGDPPDECSLKTDYDIPAGTPQVTWEAWRGLDPNERERRERAATLLKYSLSGNAFYAARGAKYGDEYWAQLSDDW